MPLPSGESMKIITETRKYVSTDDPMLLDHLYEGNALNDLGEDKLCLCSLQGDLAVLEKKTNAIALFASF